MGRVRRSVTIAAPAYVIWELVSDAYQLPRFWPRTQRVEGVSETGFTQVLLTRRERPVRVDLRYVEVEPERVLAWEQEIAGSQFERFLAVWRTRILLEPVDAGHTRVSLEEEQRFRGSFATGGLLARRAAVRRLRGALNGLAELYQ